MREPDPVACIANDPPSVTPVKTKAPVTRKGRKTTGQAPLLAVQDVPQVKRRGRPKKGTVAQTIGSENVTAKPVEPETISTVEVQPSAPRHAEPPRKRRRKQQEEDTAPDLLSTANKSTEPQACRNRAVPQDEPLLSRPSRAAKRLKTYNEDAHEAIVERPTKSHEPAVTKRRGRPAKKAIIITTSPQHIDAAHQDEAVDLTPRDNDPAEPRTRAPEADLPTAIETQKPRRRGRPARTRKAIEAPQDDTNTVGQMAAPAGEQLVSTRHSSRFAGSVNVKGTAQPQKAERKKHKRNSAVQPTEMADVPVDLPAAIERDSAVMLEPAEKVQGLPHDINPSPPQHAKVTEAEPKSSCHTKIKARNTKKPPAKGNPHTGLDGNELETRDDAGPSEQQAKGKTERSQAVPAKASKRRPLQARSTNTPSPVKSKQRVNKTTKDEWQKQDWFKASVPSELLRATDRRLQFRF